MAAPKRSRIFEAEKAACEMISSIWLRTLIVSDGRDHGLEDSETVRDRLFARAGLRSESGTSPMRGSNHAR